MLGRVIAALAIVVGVSSGATAQGDRRDLVDKIHEQITKNRTGYKKQIQNKALAGCINWENSSPDNVKVRHFFYFYTSISSDREFLPSDLMRSAIYRCNELRKARGSTCKCMPIDRNGKSALKVPDSFISKARTYTPPAMRSNPVQGDLRAGQIAFDKGDYSTAFKEWLPLANQDHVIAQSNLGFLYLNGLGTRQDDGEALKWSRKAAELGDASALFNLGFMYRHGRGVTQDDVQALMWFTIAAAQARKNRDKLTKKIRKTRDRFAKKMTPTDVTNAQKLAREWLEKREQ